MKTRKIVTLTNGSRNSTFVEGSPRPTMDGFRRQGFERAARMRVQKFLSAAALSLSTMQYVLHHAIEGCMQVTDAESAAMIAIDHLPDAECFRNG